MKFSNLIVRIVALINAGAALGIVWFWIDFYMELTISKAELAELVPHFDGYYAWETAFTLPDLILAVAIFTATFLLLKNAQNPTGKRMLTASAGAMLFLGMLDLNYAIRTDLYFIDHAFALNLIPAGVGLPLLAVFTLWVLHKCDLPHDNWGV